jgi:hypothetical protein
MRAIESDDMKSQDSDVVEVIEKGVDCDEEEEDEDEEDYDDEIDRLAHDTMGITLVDEEDEEDELGDRGMTFVPQYQSTGIPIWMPTAATAAAATAATVIALAPVPEILIPNSVDPTDQMSLASGNGTAEMKSSSSSSSSSSLYASSVSQNVPTVYYSCKTGSSDNSSSSRRDSNNNSNNNNNNDNNNNKHTTSNSSSNSVSSGRSGGDYWNKRGYQSTLSAVEDHLTAVNLNSSPCKQRERAAPVLTRASNGTHSLPGSASHPIVVDIDQDSVHTAPYGVKGIAVSSDAAELNLPSPDPPFSRTPSGFAYAPYQPLSTSTTTSTTSSVTASIATSSADPGSYNSIRNVHPLASQGAYGPYVSDRRTPNQSLSRTHEPKTAPQYVVSIDVDAGICKGDDSNEMKSKMARLQSPSKGLQHSGYVGFEAVEMYDGRQSDSGAVPSSSNNRMKSSSSGSCYGSGSNSSNSGSEDAYHSSKPCSAGHTAAPRPVSGAPYSTLYVPAMNTCQGSGTSYYPPQYLPMVNSYLLPPTVSAPVSIAMHPVDLAAKNATQMYSNQDNMHVQSYPSTVPVLCEDIDDLMLEVMMLKWEGERDKKELRDSEFLFSVTSGNDPERTDPRTVNVEAKISNSRSSSSSSSNISARNHLAVTDSRDYSAYQTNPVASISHHEAPGRVMKREEEILRDPRPLIPIQMQGIYGDGMEESQAMTVYDIDEDIESETGREMEREKQRDRDGGWDVGMRTVFEDNADTPMVQQNHCDVIRVAQGGDRTGLNGRESVHNRTDTEIMCTAADEEGCVPFMYDDTDDCDDLPPIARSTFHSPLPACSCPYSEPFTASKMRVLTPGNFYLYLPQIGPETNAPSRDGVINTEHSRGTENIHCAGTATGSVSGSVTGSGSGSGSGTTYYCRGDSRDVGEAPRSGPYVPAVPTPIKTPLPASRFSPRKIFPLPPKRIYAEDVTVKALGYGWRHLACEEHCKAFLQLLSSCRCVCFELLYRRVPTLRFGERNDYGLERQFTGEEDDCFPNIKTCIKLREEMSLGIVEMSVTVKSILSILHIRYSLPPNGRG